MPSLTNHADDFRALLVEARVEGLVEVSPTMGGFKVVLKRPDQVEPFRSKWSRYRGMPVMVEAYKPPPLRFLGVEAMVVRLPSGHRTIEAANGVFQIVATYDRGVKCCTGHLHIISPGPPSPPMKLAIEPRKGPKAWIRAAERAARSFARHVRRAVKRPKG